MQSPSGTQWGSAGESASHGRGSAGGADSMLLADQTAELCGALSRSAGGEVVIVLDNCGLELVSDLVWIPYPPFPLMVEPSEAQKRAKESVKEKSRNKVAHKCAKSKPTTKLRAELN